MKLYYRYSHQLQYVHVTHDHTWRDAHN